MKIHLLVIDPQNDFCDPKGSLFVGGAEEDTERLASFVNRVGGKLDDIHVTLDSHRLVDIAHPIFWVNSEGENPGPFTIISEDDYKNGTWLPKNPALNKRAGEYLNKLEANSRYPLCIWPPHCLIGSWGHCIPEVLYKELLNWEEKYFAMVDYVTKGSNYLTEHYSAVQADVPDSEDPGTMLNTNLIDTLQNVDKIVIAGQALSHCVANTIRDIANNFGEENIKKFVLLKDCSSNVTGFDQLGEDFINEMVGRGMEVSTSTEFLS